MAGCTAVDAREPIEESIGRRGDVIHKLFRSLASAAPPTKRQERGLLSLPSARARGLHSTTRPGSLVTRPPIASHAMAASILSTRCASRVAIARADDSKKECARRPRSALGDETDASRGGFARRPRAPIASSRDASSPRASRRSPRWLASARARRDRGPLVATRGPSRRWDDDLGPSSRVSDLCAVPSRLPFAGPSPSPPRSPRLGPLARGAPARRSPPPAAPRRSSARTRSRARTRPSPPRAASTTRARARSRISR